MLQANRKGTLADQLRKLMAVKGKENWLFTQDNITSSLAVTGENLRSVVKNFIRRGEIKCVYVALEPHGRLTKMYQYHHPFAATKLRTRKKILKAIYIAGGTFTVKQIIRLSGCPSRSYINTILRKLTQNGYVERAGRVASGYGRPLIRYHVKDRDRFRTEVIG